MSSVSGKEAGVARTERPTGKGGRYADLSLFLDLFIPHSSPFIRSLDNPVTDHSATCLGYE